MSITWTKYGVHNSQPAVHLRKESTLKGFLSGVSQLQPEEVALGHRDQMVGDYFKWLFRKYVVWIIELKWDSPIHKQDT